MNNSAFNTLVAVKATVSNACQHSRSKLLSVADLWFIQGQKRPRVQRRYAL